MILTITWSLLTTFCLWMPVGNNVVIFYVFAPLFGFGSGSIISMAPVCIGQLCKADQYGQYYGTSYSLVAFAWVTLFLFEGKWYISHVLIFEYRTFLCIPLGGQLLPSVGPEGFVAFFGGILVLSLASFLMARWACLDYRWKWNVKI
jgi:uncharacterized membrane protein YfcA